MNPLELHRFGLLCVVSGPSGSGKTTLCHRLANEDHMADYAVSATTRAPREGEVDGEDYFFLSREEFENRVEQGEFLEHAEVHGNLYGTLKSEVINRLTEGHDVLIDIDVQGAELIRRHNNEMIHDAMIDIFILPQGEDALMERLRGRGTETGEQLEIRMANAREEMKHWTDYQYTIISASKDEDFMTFCSIVQGERCRTSRLLEQ